MPFSQRDILIWALWLCAALALFLVREHPFFWDTIQLGSKHAHWYYENGFRQILLPDEIDSGHPPAFGMYLALVWMLFGKSLLASHMAMLPFLMGIIWLLFAIGDHFGSYRNSWMLVLLVLAGPVFAGQAVLVSPDIPLVCFFLLVLYGILYRHAGARILGSIALAVISTRGMMVVAVLYFFELAAYWEKHWFFPVKKALPYLPAAILAAAFLAYHHQEKGWIGYHEAMPWAPSFERVGPAGFFKNIAVLGWRLLDFGRLFVWLGLGWLLFQRWKTGTLLNHPSTRRALWLLLLALPLLSITFLLYRGLQGHRYLLPVFLSITLLFYTALCHTPLTDRVRQLLFGVVLAGLLSGNLWVYPDTVSQGWDSTLAHLPYYSLKEAMFDYMEKENISMEEVGTAFPEIGPQKFKNLSDNLRGMHPKDLAFDSYIFYSNVMNDFTDEEIRRLREEWQVVKAFKQGGIKVILYRR